MSKSSIYRAFSHNIGIIHNEYHIKNKYLYEISIAQRGQRLPYFPCILGKGVNFEIFDIFVTNFLAHFSIYENKIDGKYSFP